MGDEQRELFLRVTRPGDPGNPWRKGLQVRNFALLMVLYEHGLRISDVQQLRMDDLRIEKGLFTIAERIADPEETRRRRPNPKRRGNTVRTLRFSPTSLEAMQMWLVERAQRDKWPGATKNAFVFLSHWAKTSKPLAMRRPGQFFQDLRKAHPEKHGKDGQVLNVGFSNDYFHPHALRHDRAVRFVLDYDAKHGWDRRGEEGMRKVFGWSLDSRQPAYYADAAFLRIGVKAMLELTDHRTQMGLAMETEEEE
jgi:integrase